MYHRSHPQKGRAVWQACYHEPGRQRTAHGFQRVWQPRDCASSGHRSLLPLICTPREYRLTARRVETTGHVSEDCSRIKLQMQLLLHLQLHPHRRPLGTLLQNSLTMNCKSQHDPHCQLKIHAKSCNTIIRQCCCQELTHFVAPAAVCTFSLSLSLFQSHEHA